MEPERKPIRTPTDAIVAAMEMADEMEQIYICYRSSKVGAEHDHIGWITNLQDPLDRVALIEASKLYMIMRARMEEGDED